jgi:hypothetical protein
MSPVSVSVACSSLAEMGMGSQNSELIGPQTQRRFHHTPTPTHTTRNSTPTQLYRSTAHRFVWISSCLCSVSRTNSSRGSLCLSLIFSEPNLSSPDTQPWRPEDLISDRCAPLPLLQTTMQGMDSDDCMETSLGDCRGARDGLGNRLSGPPLCLTRLSARVSALR